MYRIFFTNFGYYSQDSFGSESEAAKYGKSKGFEFQVYQEDRMVGSWTVFGGYRSR